jgi:hypothetical protein
MEPSANHYFNIASQKLSEANEELFQNGDGFNKSFVCKNTHIALKNFLKGFLVYHNITPIEESLEQMFEQCVLIDVYFSKIDFKNVICRKDDTLFLKCEDPRHITDCFETADNIDTYFRRIKILN